jgi:serine phosphatase RsbU (regulator of sigma subunit)
VMGRGLSPSLLALCVHQRLAPKEIEGQAYRVRPPDEVLLRLNRELLSLGTTEPPLVRLTYGVVSTTSGEVSIACAGHTPPLCLPAAGPAQLWRNVGPLLGQPDVRFPVQRAVLRPGDRLLLYTDGLSGTAPDQAEQLLAAVHERRGLALNALVESLTQALLTQTADPDDFTMLGLEFQETAGST